MKVDSLTLIQTFMNVVEAGSFTTASQKHGVSQPTISRQISALEKRLEARLFNRSTRSMTLTDEGERYYNHMIGVMDALENAASDVGSYKALVKGRLRIGAPIALGLVQIMPRLPKFLERWPEISVDLEFNDRPVDLVEEGIEVSIRVGFTSDQSLISRKIGETKRIAVAHSDYLAKYGEPEHPDELKNHECVIYTRLPHPRKWMFKCPNTGDEITVPVSGRVHVNTSDGNRQAARGGLGIAIVPNWLLPNGAEAEGLVQILEAYEPQSVPITAVFPSRKLISARARAFIDYMAEEFRA